MKWILVLSMAMMASSLQARNADRAWEILKQTRQEIFLITAYDSEGIDAGHGSGFKILDSKNRPRIITAGHICRGYDGTLKVNITPRGKPISIGIVTSFRTSPVADLCELTVKWNKPKLMMKSGLKLAKKAVRNEYVFIVGYPKVPYMTSMFGRLKGLGKVHLPAPWVTKTTECIASPKYHYHELVCYMDVKSFETTVPTMGGASGGPLLNNIGEVVGSVVAADLQISWSSTSILKDLREFLATP